MFIPATVEQFEFRIVKFSWCGFGTENEIYRLCISIFDLDFC